MKPKLCRLLHHVAALRLDSLSPSLPLYGLLLSNRLAAAVLLLPAVQQQRQLSLSLSLFVALALGRALVSGSEASQATTTAGSGWRSQGFCLPSRRRALCRRLRRRLTIESSVKRAKTAAAMPTATTKAAEATPTTTTTTTTTGGGN